MLVSWAWEIRQHFRRRPNSCSPTVMRWTWALYAGYSPDGDNLRADNVNNQWTLNTQEGVEGVLTLGRGTTYIYCMKQQCLKGCRPLQWVVWVWSRGKRRQRQRAGEAVSWSSPDKHIPPKSWVQICNCSCFGTLIMLTSCCLFLILGGRDTLASSTSQLLLERSFGYWIVPLFPQLHELFLNLFLMVFLHWPVGCPGMSQIENRVLKSFHAQHLRQIILSNRLQTNLAEHLSNPSPSLLPLIFPSPLQRSFQAKLWSYGTESAHHIPHPPPVHLSAVSLLSKLCINHTCQRKRVIDPPHQEAP